MRRVVLELDSAAYNVNFTASPACIRSFALLDMIQGRRHSESRVRATVLLWMDTSSVSNLAYNHVSRVVTTSLALRPRGERLSAANGAQRSQHQCSS